MPFAVVSRVMLNNDRGVKIQMQEQRGDNIPPDLWHNSYNLISNRGEEGDMKVFFSSFLPPLCSHQPRPRMPPLDYHRSSFLFCFSPRVPIQSIFISPSVPFTTAFISTPSLNLWQLLFFHNPSQSFHELSHKFFLTSSTCLSSFSSFFQPHMPYFSFDCFPSRFSSLPFSTRTHFHSVKCTISPSSLSKALRGPIKFSGLMSLSNPAHLELTGL